MHRKTGKIYALSGISYAEVLEKMVNELTKKVPWHKSDSFCPFPFAIMRDRLTEMEHLCLALRIAVEKVVSHYFEDPRIQRIYQLDPFLESILQIAKGCPYSVGALRPDFLYSAEGQIKICEIGARFPLNGWMISFYLNQFNSELSYFSTTGLLPIPEIETIPEKFSQFFRSDQPITLIIDNEKGCEIHSLLREFRQKGLETRIAKPQDLELKNGKIQLDGSQLEQFILEVDREELRKFQPEVIEKIIRESRYFNDVRTLILVHDKRILAVLYDEDIALDYLPSELYQVLRPFLIPTFSLASSNIKQVVLSDPAKWVLKQNSGGRGLGMYVGKECELSILNHAIAKQNSAYMVQEYVPQKFFTLPWNEDRVNKPALQINLVGMLLCFNEDFLGLGIYRGSEHSIINVAEGRGKIFAPALLS